MLTNSSLAKLYKMPRKNISVQKLAVTLTVWVVTFFIFLFIIYPSRPYQSGTSLIKTTEPFLSSKEFEMAISNFSSYLTMQKLTEDKVRFYDLPQRIVLNYYDSSNVEIHINNSRIKKRLMEQLESALQQYNSKKKALLELTRSADNQALDNSNLSKLIANELFTNYLPYEKEVKFNDLFIVKEIKTPLDLQPNSIIAIFLSFILSVFMAVQVWIFSKKAKQ